MPSEILPRLATLACLLAATASADQLVLQNFDALPVQTVADGASATIGASPRTLSLLSSAGTGIRILETSAGNKKLRFTDNQHGGAAPTMTSAVFSGVGGGGLGHLVGSFEFRALQGTSGPAPSFVFMVNANSQVHSGSHTSVMITFSDHQGAAVKVSYSDAGVTVPGVALLEPDTDYRLDLVADYGATGSANRDSYVFTITDIGAPAVVYRSPVIATRSHADLSPNRISFYAGAGNTVFRPEPFFQVDNLDFRSAAQAPRRLQWGVSGHPTINNATSYWSVVPLAGQSAKSPVGQLDLVAELGCDYYRFDTGNPARFAELLAAADARGIRLLPILGVAGELFDTRTDEQLEADCYAKALTFAQTYAGRFTHIELANELDNKCILNANVSGAAASDYDAAKYERVRRALAGLAAGVREGDPAVQRIINTTGWYHYGFLERLVADGVPFEVTGLHWYSSMGSVARVMPSYLALGKPIWVTEANRFGGSLVTTKLVKELFTDTPTGDAPAGWTAAGNWRVREFGPTKALFNEDAGAASGRSITRLLDAPLSGDWELAFAYDWRWGGNSSLGYGSHSLIIDCDVVNAAGDGYRVRVRQGDGGNPANASSVLGVYTLSGGVATLLPDGQSAGYNQPGFANGQPRPKTIRLRRDLRDSRLRVACARDEAGGPDKDGALENVILVEGATLDGFDRVVFTARGFGNNERPMLDDIVLTRYYSDEAAQAATLTSLVSELRHFPGVEAVFIYELLAQPNRGTFDPEAYYGLCEIGRDANGGRVFSHRKEAFHAYRAEIAAQGDVLATPAGGMIVDDAYPSPSVTPLPPGDWTESANPDTYWLSGYKHDGPQAKAASGSVRFHASIPVAGPHEVAIRFPVSPANDPSVPVRVKHAGGIAEHLVDQTRGDGDWVILGVYPFEVSQPGVSYGAAGWENWSTARYVEIGTAGTSGRVVVDAVRFRPVPAAP